MCIVSNIHLIIGQSNCNIISHSCESLKILRSYKVDGWPM